MEGRIEKNATEKKSGPDRWDEFNECPLGVLKEWERDKNPRDSGCKFSWSKEKHKSSVWKAS